MPLYFAYGANMDVAAMAARCPASVPLGPARLAHHRFLVMPDGVASVRRAPGSTVHGLLWNLALADVPALDAFEEVAAGKYAKAFLPVLRPGGAARAIVYLGWSTASGPARPGYLEAVIAAGHAAGLPPAYLATLAALRAGGTRGTPFSNAEGPRPAVRPRFATPLDRSEGLAPHARAPHAPRPDSKAE